MNIALILASNRPERQSNKPAFYIAEKLRAAGHTVDFLDLMTLDLPLFNDSPERINTEQVQHFKKSIVAADGYIAVVPEYNHQPSSSFKNAIDYLRNREFMNKPMGLVGVSDGQIGGARAIFVMRGSLPTFGTILLPTAVQVGPVQDIFPDEKTCTSPKVEGSINKMLRELELYVPALATIREELAK